MVTRKSNTVRNFLCTVLRVWNYRGNEDSCGNENRKSRHKIFSVGKKSTSILIFS